MPAMIRLAAIGAARNERMAESSHPENVDDLLSRCPGWSRGTASREEIDVVVEQLDVVGHGFLTPPTDGASTSTLPPTWVAIDCGVFRSKYGSTTMILTPCALHLVDELERVRRRRRNAGLRLDIAHDVEAEALHEVRPRAVIGHDLRALVRRHRRVPPLLRRGEARVEVGVALREVGLVGRRELAELVADRLRDEPPVVGIEPVVRVAERVHVAHRAGDLPGRNLENLHVERRVEIPVRARPGSSSCGCC